MKEIIQKKIELEKDLINSYKESIEFCSKNKDWILCNNYEIRITLTNRFIKELEQLLIKL